VENSTIIMQQVLKMQLNFIVA